MCLYLYCRIGIATVNSVQSRQTGTLYILKLVEKIETYFFGHFLDPQWSGWPRRQTQTYLVLCFQIRLCLSRLLARITEDYLELHYYYIICKHLR